MTLSYSDYQNNVTVVCLQCNWKGKVNEMGMGDYHEYSNIADFNCPKCHQYLAHVQFPIHDPKDSKGETARCAQ